MVNILTSIEWLKNRKRKKYLEIMKFLNELFLEKMFSVQSCYETDSYAYNFLYDTLVCFVAFVGANVFWLLWTDILGRFCVTKPDMDP